jgi:hypothetical protein
MKMLPSIFLHPKNVQFLFQLRFLPIHSDACMSDFKRNNLFKCNFLMTTCLGSLKTLYWKTSLAPRMKPTSRTTSVMSGWQDILCQFIHMIIHCFCIRLVIFNVYFALILQSFTYLLSLNVLIYFQWFVNHKKLHELLQSLKYKKVNLTLRRAAWCN